MIRTPRTAARKFLAGGFTGALLGATILAAPTAFADDIPVGGDGSVDLTLEVEDRAPTGELSMMVDTDSPVALVESGSDTDPNRTFTGTLPTVTVTDTRSDIDPDAAWAVVGQADDFVQVADPSIIIPAAHLGWTPELLTDIEEQDDVTAGDQVESVTDGGTGLTTGLDFLVWSFTSGEAQENTTEWQANAELSLVAPADAIEAGNYTSTLTLSLFES